MISIAIQKFDSTANTTGDQADVEHVDPQIEGLVDCSERPIDIQQ
jgi:hypothetical protein